MKKSALGKRYTKLVVVAEQKKRGSAGEVKWVCKCDCGRITRVKGTCLRSGHTKSCGCLIVEKARVTARVIGRSSKYKKRKAPGVSGSTYLFNHYKYGAKKRGFSWGLTKDEFVRLTSSLCYYCGKSPSQVAKTGRDAEAKEHSKYVYNGVDRVDSLGGYTRENCVACCGDCNIIKSNWEVNDLFGHLEKMLNRYNNRRGLSEQR